jgi:LCP family protein required for cell wall assembly
MADDGSRDGGAAARPSWRARLTGSHRRTVVLGTWATLAVLVLGGAGLGFVYLKLNGNISGVDINSALGSQRPEDAPNGSLDILVMGSDSRAGQNAEYGSDGGARSDTAMIVHVAEGHDEATVVSIPRDTLVARPSCEDEDGEVAAPVKQAMFNEAYGIGGPVCAVKTVEAMTGIRMDHYVEVDFSGFKDLVDALGGVEVTTREALRDPDSHLDLPAGRHTLDGEQALGLVRTRHAVGDGSDLGRIELQQAFVRALMERVNDVGLFGDPKKLYELGDTATSALTTDSDLASVGDLMDVARVLGGVRPDDLHMITMPVRYDPADPNRVLPVRGAGEKVWKALREDRPVPASVTDDTAGEESGLRGVVR